MAGTPKQPRSRKCPFCGLRLRAKTLTMHRQCQREHNEEPPMPDDTELEALIPPTKPKKVYDKEMFMPQSTFCDGCKRLDNSLIPSKSCKYCAQPMRYVGVDFLKNYRGGK